MAANLNSVNKRTFWIVVVGFALANLALWGWFAMRGSNRGLLRLEAFEPGDNAVVEGRPTFTWRFNLDVAHGNTDEAPPVKITPAVAGDWKWTDSRTLLFNPTDNLPRATNVRFDLLPDRLRTRENFRLPTAVNNSVSTPALQVEEVQQAGMLEDNRFVLALKFNDRVLPADVQTHLHLIGPDGKTLGFVLNGDAAGEVVRVETDSIPRQADAPTITVQLGQTLAGLSGPLGLHEAYETKFKLEDGITCTNISPRAPNKGDLYVYAELTGQADPQVLRQVISIQPQVKFNVNPSGNSVEISGDFQCGTRYAVKFADPPKGVDPRTCPRPGLFSVFMPDRSPDVWLEHTEGVLGSKGNRTLLAHAVNVSQVEATVLRVYENNLVAWRNASGRYNWRAQDAFSKPVSVRKIKLANVKNQPEDFKLNIDDLLSAGDGKDGVYRISLRAVDASAASTDENTDERDEDESPRLSRPREGSSAVVTLSDIGLVAKQHKMGITVWAVSLNTAKPMANVRVRVFSDKNQLLSEATTNADGLAEVQDVHPAQGEKARVILADRQPAATTEPSTNPAAALPTEPELTWLDLSRESWNLSESDTAGEPYLRDGMDAFVYTDRGVYRPGETVQLRSILRNSDGAVTHTFPLRWRFIRPDGRPWRGEMSMVDADGAAGYTLHLPDDLMSGRWNVQVGIPDEQGGVGRALGSESFLVEEYMPDRMKVAVHVGGDSDAKADEPRVSAEDDSIPLHVQADYLFGQPAANLHGEVSASLEPAVFSPKEFAGWSFGDSAGVMDAASNVAIKPEWTQKPTELETDNKGHASLALATDELHRKPRSTTQPTDLGVDQFMGPWHLTTIGSVEEAGGRAVSGSDAAMVDIVPFYIGLHAATATMPPNQPGSIAISLVGTDGQLAAKDETFSVSLFCEQWNTSLIYRNNRYQFDSTRVLDPVSNGVTSEIHVIAGQATLSVTPPHDGRYVLRVRDPQTGLMTSLAFFATDGQAWDDNVSRENPEHVELVLLSNDATTQPADQRPHEARPFKAGQTARVLVRSPFAGRLLLTVETDRIVQSKVIEMPASQMEVPVDVTLDCWPNAYISATVVRDVQPNLKWRTHRAYGVCRLPMDSSDRKLNVVLEHPKDMRPNSPLNVAIRITSPDGTPATNTAVTLAAVDEGILQLTDFASPDPLSYFSEPRALGVTSWDLYSDLMPEVPKANAQSASGGDGDAGEDARHRSGVTTRRVKPVALFSGVLHTDANGVANASFDVPQHEGQLRLMAVAYNAKCVGSGAAKITVRSPLIAQSSLPRFIAPGDHFNATLRVFNNTSAAGDADVHVDLGESPLLAFNAGGDSQRAFSVGNIAAGGQADVTVPLVALQRIGSATVQLHTTLGDEHADETIDLPVRPASPQITRGGYATVEPNKPLDLKIDHDMLPGTGTLQVRVTNWPQLRLPEGLDYLESYPYGCAEQTTSSCFPLVYLGDIGPHIAPGMFEKQRVAEKLQTGILRLMGMQTADGGLAMWPGESRSWPWVSVYAAHMLIEAQKAGHKVPEDFQHRLIAYVRHQLDTLDDTGDALEVQSYACYVLALSGKADRSAMNRLTELATTTSAAAKPEYADQRNQARLYLAMAESAAGRPDRAAALIPPPQTIPQPRSTRQHAGNIGSAIRDQAVLIDAMLTAQADHPALPDLVQRLADSGRDGNWRNTHDCAFAVMALGRYLKTSQNHAPFTAAQLVVDGQSTINEGELFWTGNPPADGPLHISITGDAGARGNVSWTQIGVPMKPPADVDNGLRVRRAYCDSTGKPLPEAIVRTGDLVRVDVMIEASPGMENLVVEDLLPAGLEIENPALETTAAKGEKKEVSPDGVLNFSPDRVEMHDDRLVIMGTMPQSWKARYSYLARAVSVGKYTLPPVRGECMYDIGINSIHGSGTFVVRPFENNVTAKTE